jgi:hypothetical protein
MKGLARVTLQSADNDREPITRRDITRRFKIFEADLAKVYEQIALLMTGKQAHTPETVVAVMSVVLGSLRHGANVADASRLTSASEMLAQAAEVLGGRRSTPP